MVKTVNTLEIPCEHDLLWTLGEMLLSILTLLIFLKVMELRLPFLTLVCQRIILILERSWTGLIGPRRRHLMMVRNNALWSSEWSINLLYSIVQEHVLTKGLWNTETYRALSIQSNFPEILCKWLNETEIFWTKISEVWVYTVPCEVVLMSREIGTTRKFCFIWPFLLRCSFSIISWLCYSCTCISVDTTWKIPFVLTPKFFKTSNKNVWPNGKQL